MDTFPLKAVFGKFVFFALPSSTHGFPIHFYRFLLKAVFGKKHLEAMGDRKGGQPIFYRFPLKALFGKFSPHATLFTDFRSRLFSVNYDHSTVRKAVLRLAHE